MYRLFLSPKQPKLKGQTASLFFPKKRRDDTGLQTSVQLNRLPYPKERQLKGQTEIILVVGIVIVAVAAVLFATNTISLLPPEPESISVLKSSLALDLQTRINSESVSVIRKVAANGGYLDLNSDPKPPVLDYSGAKIAFWQYGNASLIRGRQDFEKAIATGIKESLKTIDAKSFSGVQGKDVKIESARNVEVKINNKDINIKVDLPVSVEGYGFGGPVEVKVQSRLGESIDFANNLIGKGSKKEISYAEPDEKGQATGKPLGTLENRYFERFLINAIQTYSDVDEFDNPRIPSQGILTGCETPPVQKTWFNIRPEMQSLVEGVLANTYTAGKVPLGITNRSRYPAYVLPIYSDLDVKFSLGQKLDEKSFQLYQNNGIDPGKVIIKTKNFGYTSICMSPPYRVVYFLFFPVVTEIGNDDFKLRFAFHNYVNGYQPGDFKDLGLVLNFFEDDVIRCNTAACPAKIKLIDTDGPISSADVSYSYCNLGKTDKNGIIETNVPCGISLLEIWDKDHKAYQSLRSSDELKDETIALSKQRDIKLHIYNMEMQYDPDTEEFRIVDVSPNIYNFTLAVSPLEGIPAYIKFNTDSQITKLIPTEEIITMNSVVNRGGALLGGTDIIDTVPETITDLWLYNPIIKNGYPSRALPNPANPSDPIEVKLQKEQDPENRKVINENTANQIMIRLGLTNVTLSCAAKLNVTLPLSSTSVDPNLLKTCRTK